VLVVRRRDAAVAVWAADCAPIVLIDAAGGLAAVHAGWRGLAAGVLDVAVGALRARGGEIVAAVLGPVIHPCCYAFGRSDLARVAEGVHAPTEAITARTRDGDIALDVPSAVSAALRHAGVPLDVVGPCTGCDERWYSYRRRGDVGRHAVVAWTEPA
jgi:copper oxidase (laccase) domain-containing protein